MRIHPGPLGPAIEAARTDAAAVVPRIWDRDHTVWQDDPTECADRLGWLDSPTSETDRAAEFHALAEDVRASGIDRVLLVGMGGSSLYPEVLSTVVADGSGARLDVLDTTHPAAVQRARDGFDPQRTLLVPASKSGTTIETRSHLERFWADLVEALGADDAGAHVVPITDPGSDLVTMAAERGFRKLVTNPPDIGGRFSALSAFGLVPAALAGIDPVAHLAPAAAMAATARDLDLDANEPALLGAVLAAAAWSNRYQLTLLFPDELAPFGAWIEQLVAESTGKHGRGLLPVLGEPPLPPDAYGNQRLVVTTGGFDLGALAGVGHPVVELPAAAPSDLAAEVFRWEFATAVCGALLGINPFDQPDVAAAKSATARVLDQGDTDLPTVGGAELLAGVEPDGHVALLAYVDPAGEVAGRLPGTVTALRNRLDVPVTLGFGPRYLHSTGQFHKGGPDKGVHVILVEPADVDVDVPGRDYTFGRLLKAQALGDLDALRSRGRRAGIVDPDAFLGGFGQ